MSEKVIKSLYITKEFLDEIEISNTSFNNRVLDLIKKGLMYEQQNNPKYIVDNTFNCIRELIRLRDNKEIKITLNKG